MTKNIEVALDHGLPRLTCRQSPLRWELFKHTPHEEGWFVLCWAEYPEEDDVTCIESYHFGEDLIAALIKFAELTNEVQ